MALQNNFQYEVYAGLDICSTFCLVPSQINGALQLWTYLFACVFAVQWTPAEARDCIGMNLVLEAFKPSLSDLIS